MQTLSIQMSMSRDEWIALIRLAMSADAKQVERMYTTPGHPEKKLEYEAVQKTLHNSISCLGATNITILPNNVTQISTKGSK